MAGCLAAAVLAAGAIAGREAAVATALAPILLGSVILSRYDLWPTALAVVALAALLRGKLTIAGILLGTALAAKFWPAVLVPPMAVWVWRRRGRAEAAGFLAATVAAAAAWFLPFVALSPGGVWYTLHNELARPLQLESLGGAVLITLHHLTGRPLHMASSYGSQNLFGPGAHAAAVATSIAGALALLAVWIAYAWRDGDDDRLVRACAAAAVTLLAFGKVFSPQFLIWLIPLVPLVVGRNRRVAIVLFAVALGLTQVWFPQHYWNLASDFASPYWWALVLRDLAVVALLVVLVWPGSERKALREDRARVEALEPVGAQVE